MIAVFIREGIYSGYIETDTEQAKTFELDYILYDELPDTLINIPKDYYAKLVDDVWQHIPYPGLPEEDADRIAELAAENAALKSQIDEQSSRLSDLELAFADILTT